MTGTLGGLSFRNIKGSYFAALEETQQASWIPNIANVVESDQPYEIYKFLGGVPIMDKWQGERRRQQLKDFGFTVVTDKFESTVEIDVDDYRRDKTGQVLRRIRELGAQAAVLPQRLFTTLLEANGTAYEGSAFFADSHAHGGTVDNLLTLSTTAPDTPTSAEMSTAILNAVQAMYGFTDDRGQPCNEFALQFLLMVPPKYWQAAKAAMQNDFTSAGVSNTLKNAGVQIGLVVNPRLLGTAAAAGRRMYLFRTDAPVKPLIWQEEMITDAFKTLGPDSSEGFWKDQLAFGAKRIGAAALGRFEYAVRTELQ